MTIKRPMLAATWVEGTKLRFPLASSPKLDGLRVLCHPELGPVTRSFKPVPNEHVREMLYDPMFAGFDGEMMLTDSNANFNAIQSAVMRKDGKPDFEYFVFDDFTHPERPWVERGGRVNTPATFITPLKHVAVSSEKEMLAQEILALKLGFEGLMLRDPRGMYKSGRSTLREQGLIKLKRFKDAEGVVVRLVEQMHNDNPAGQDAFGLIERSSHKNNMRPAGCLGKIVIQTLLWGEVHVGTGFTQAERDEIWAHPNLYVGQTVTFKYQEVLKDKPRFPVFLHWRNE